VIERFVTYQKLALSVRKNCCIADVSAAADRSGHVLIVFWSPTCANSRKLYNSIRRSFPTPTPDPNRQIGTTARGYVLFGFVAVVGPIALRAWGKTPRARKRLTARC